MSSIFNGSHPVATHVCLSAPVEIHAISLLLLILLHVLNKRKLFSLLSSAQFLFERSSLIKVFISLFLNTSSNSSHFFIPFSFRYICNKSYYSKLYARSSSYIKKSMNKLFH